MITILASNREFLDATDYLVEIFPGEGNITATGTAYLYFQSANRVGLNLQQVNPLEITYNPGDRIQITWEGTAIKSGEEVFYLVVSIANTNDPEDAVLLSAIAMREADGVTPKALPVVFDITEDSHLNLNRLYPDSASFPSGNDLIDGAIATINGETGNYLYDSTLATGDVTATGKPGHWTRTHLPIFTFVDHIRNAGGTDVQLFELVQGEYLGVPQRQYGFDSLPIRVWILNDDPEQSGSVIRAGKNFTLSALIDGRSGETSKLADTISFTVVGQARKATGILYTDIEGANFTSNWNPGTGQLIEVRQDILPGYALVVDIWFNQQSDRLIDRGTVRAGENIVIEDIYDIGEIGIRSDLWDLTGDAVIQGLRLVPAEVLTGIGVIKGFRIKLYTNKAIAGQLADTADQIVAMSASRGGDVTVYQDENDLDATEAILGTIGTIASFYNPSDPSNSVTLSADSALNLTVSLPVTGGQRALIRADYPEEDIRSLAVHWHNPKIRVYLIRDQIIYSRNELIDSASTSSQVITIDNLDDYSQVLQVPLQSDPYQGMFGYGILSMIDGGSGSLPAGEYTAIVAYEDTQPNTHTTSISHQSGIPTVSLTDTQTDYWKNTKLSVTEARALRASDLQEGFIFGVNVNKRYVPYVYDPTITASDNGASVIKPTYLSSSPGALIPLPTLGHRIVNSDGLLPPRHQIRIVGDGAIVTDSAANNETVILISAIAVDPPTVSPNLIWHDGNLLKWHDGSLL